MEMWYPSLYDEPDYYDDWIELESKMEMLMDVESYDDYFPELGQDGK